MSNDEIKEIVKRKMGENEVDYDLLVRFIDSWEKTLKAFYNKQDLQITLDRLYHLSADNHWKDRRNNYLNYKIAVDMLESRAKLTAMNADSIEYLMNIDVKLLGLINEELEKSDVSPQDLQTLIKSFKDFNSVMRLNAGLNDSAVAIDQLLKVNSTNDDFNTIEAMYNEVEEGMEELEDGDSEELQDD